MSHSHTTTTTVNIVPSRARVDELCKILGQIGSKEADLKAGDRAILELALDAGDHLIAVKDDVGHGKFGGWVKANVACTPCTARKYMRLAENRALIEEQMETGFVLSIRGALRLINSKKPARPKQGEVNTEPPSPKVDPYSPEALAKLSVEERARLVANLGLTRADLSAAVKADVAQHAASQEQRADDKRQADDPRPAARDKCLSTIRTTLATAAPPQHKLETIEAAFAVLAKRTQPVCDRIDLKTSRGNDVMTPASPNPSDDDLDIPGFPRRDPPPTIN